MSNTTLEAAAHVVQFALTPVFLLSGIASLMNVFTTRMWRVSGQAGRAKNETHVKLNHWRARSLVTAVGLAALAGSLTCASALVLFVGAVGGADTARWLFGMFGGAMVLTMGALAAFFVEILLAGVIVLEDYQETHHQQQTHTPPPSVKGPPHKA